MIAVRRYGSSGSLIAEKVIPTEAVAIAPELRRSIIGRGMEMASWHYHSPVAAIFATHDGNVWLHEARGASTSGVTFQADPSPQREGWAWGTGTGDLDIPYIALFRLSEGTCDAG